QTDDGRVSKQIKKARASVEVNDNEEISKIIVNINDNLGASPKSSGKAYLIETAGDSVISREAFDFKCIYDSGDENSNLACIVDVDREMYYEGGMNYYICFDEGAIETDDVLSLPLEIELQR
ncbi:MAG: hypothetical protein Q4D20_05575, partial [Clostridia bacterium]|nr:hypothetical protein [Clostridia bacterium]